MQEMEAYKQMKDEEAANLRKDEEEQMKLQKQEALQLLKKKEKTENIIKVLLRMKHIKTVFVVVLQLLIKLSNVHRKRKRIRKRRSSRKETRILTPTSLKGLHRHSFYSGKIFTMAKAKHEAWCHE